MRQKEFQKQKKKKIGKVAESKYIEEKEGGRVQE